MDQISYRKKLPGTTRFSLQDLARIKEIGRLPWNERPPAREVAQAYCCGLETIRRIWREETFVGVGGKVNAGYEPPPMSAELEEELRELARKFETGELKVKGRA